MSTATIVIPEHNRISHDPPLFRDIKFVIKAESREIIPMIQAQATSHQAAQWDFILSTQAKSNSRHASAYPMHRLMRRRQAHPYCYMPPVNTVASPIILLNTDPAYPNHQIAMNGRRGPENLSRDSPSARGLIQILSANTHLDYTPSSLGLLVTTKHTKHTKKPTMAKSMRSKSKRAFRRTKREEGVYAAAHAARLERLSTRLAAKVSADKDGDQTMEEEEEPTEQQVGGGERLSISGDWSLGVDAGVALRPVLDNVHKDVTGGEDNLNNTKKLCEPMARMSPDEGMEEDGGMEMEGVYRPVASLSLWSKAGGTEMERCQSMGLSLVEGGDIEMAEPDAEPDAEMEELCQPMAGPSLDIDQMEELCKCMSQLSIEDPWYDMDISIRAWRRQVADAIYEGEEGQGSPSSETESELLTPEGQPLNDPDEWWENNPLFELEYNDPFAQAAYVRPHYPGDAHTLPDYPRLFQGDLGYETPQTLGDSGACAPGGGVA